jgi:hypothetical protein
MSFSRPFQWYHSNADPTWPDGSFNVLMAQSPTPQPQASVPPPRFWGEGHNRWRERGWESPNSDEGTYKYFVVNGHLFKDDISSRLHRS